MDSPSKNRVIHHRTPAGIIAEITPDQNAPKKVVCVPLAQCAVAAHPANPMLSVIMACGIVVEIIGQPGAVAMELFEGRPQIV